MADEQRDVIEVLEHDHREVEEMFSELESLRGASTDEDEVAAQGPRRAGHDRARPALGRRGGARLPEGRGRRSAPRRPSTPARSTPRPRRRSRGSRSSTRTTRVRRRARDTDGARSATTSRTRRARCSRTCARSSTRTSCASSARRVEAFKKVAPTRPHPNVPNEALPRLAAGPGGVAVRPHARPRDRARHRRLRTREGFGRPLEQCSLPSGRLVRTLRHLPAPAGLAHQNR